MLPPPRRELQKEYDFVIVGAGSAGCMLANELSADGTKEILLLEAGGWDWNPLIHIPAGVYSVFKDPSLNWNMETESEPACEGRNIELPRGKVVGGSSAINAMVYMRGVPSDYDSWREIHGLDDWGFESVLPYFKACETSDRGESEFRGGKGRLSVTQGSMENPMYTALMEAGVSSGQGVSEDLNGYKPEGVARLDRTATPEGRRCSAADAHLLPALGRPNLTLVTGRLVERVAIEGSCATGVHIASIASLPGENETTFVEARESVVLSAGAIKSPQLLCLSGVGPKDHLAEHDIECIHHLPGVGANLMDHACINTAFACSPDSLGARASLSHLSQPLQKLKVGAQWLLTGNGPCASNIWEAGGLVYGQEHGHLHAPNLQYHFTPVFSSYNGLELELIPGYQMQVDLLRPKSRGNVRLSSNNPRANPLVKFNYLSDPRDLAELVDGYRTAQNLLRQPSFDQFGGEIALPESDLKTNAEIEAFVRGTSGTDYHPCGTCRMGSEHDDMAVVDGQCRVHGIDRLHVVDASVMPSIVSGNLNAPTQMIALKASFSMRNRPALSPERPRFSFD